MIARTLLSLGLVLAAAVPSAAQQEQVRGKHGAWSMVCSTPPGASSEQCAMMQNVVAEDRPEMGLSVVVFRTADNTFKNGKSAVFIVFQAPEEGIGIPVDLNGFAEGFEALP